jgi:AraC-like DNA-binding protein
MRKGIHLMNQNKKFHSPSLGRDADTLSLSLFGLHALVAEMASQGVSIRELVESTGVHPRQFDDPQSLISRRQRLVIYANAERLAKRSDVALRAGARQRVSDFGIFGYALVSSRTLGDALDFCFKHLWQAGPVLHITSSIDGDVGVMRSHHPDSLGDLLPFVAEFWRSSNHSILSRVLEAPFPSVRMLLPYPAPVHWRLYEEMFNCPVEFDAGVMEWHYDAHSRALPLPNANHMTALLCENFCDQLLSNNDPRSDLAQSIRTLLVNRPGHFANIDEIADQLGISPRTLHRHLASEGLSYQVLVDDMRQTLAIEYLERTSMAIENIAERVGFSDASNFRKAFKKWTGITPSEFRTAVSI